MARVQPYVDNLPELLSEGITIFLKLSFLKVIIGLSFLVFEWTRWYL